MLLRHYPSHVLVVTRFCRQRQFSVRGSSVVRAPPFSRMHRMLCGQNLGCVSPFVQLIVVYGYVLTDAVERLTCTKRSTRQRRTTSNSSPGQKVTKSSGVSIDGLAYGDVIFAKALTASKTPTKKLVRHGARRHSKSAFKGRNFAKWCSAPQ